MKNYYSIYQNLFNHLVEKKIGALEASTDDDVNDTEIANKMSDIIIESLKDCANAMHSHTKAHVKFKISSTGQDYLTYFNNNIKEEMKNIIGEGESLFAAQNEVSVPDEVEQEYDLGIYPDGSAFGFNTNYKADAFQEYCQTIGNLINENLSEKENFDESTKAASKHMIENILNTLTNEKNPIVLNKEKIQKIVNIGTTINIWNGNQWESCAPQKVLEKINFLIINKSQHNTL